MVEEVVVVVDLLLEQRHFTFEIFVGQFQIVDLFVGRANRVGEIGLRLIEFPLDVRLVVADQVRQVRNVVVHVRTELNISSSNYRNVACFCTSSFTGEPVNGYITEEQFQKAYNIHLPFIWLLSKIIDFDGTKKQDVFQPEEETEATSSRSFSRQSAPEGERRNRRHRSANNSSENKSNARRVNELIDDD